MASRGKKKKQNLEEGIVEEKSIQKPLNKTSKSIAAVWWKEITLIFLITITVLFLFFPMLSLKVSGEGAELFSNYNQNSYFNGKDILEIPTLGYTKVLDYLASKNEVINAASKIGDIFYEKLSQEITQKDLDSFKKIFYVVYALMICKILLYVCMIGLLAFKIKKKKDDKILKYIYIYCFVSVLIFILLGVLAGFSTKSLIIRVGVGMWLAFFANIITAGVIALTGKKRFKNKVS